MTPNLPLRYKNASLGSGLVNMSAIYSFVWTYSNLISLSCTNSLTKWYFIAICLVLECIIGFFEMLIALVLSQNMTTDSLISTFMPSNNYLNQTILEQFIASTTYSASTTDWDMQFYFLLVQDTNIIWWINWWSKIKFLWFLIHPSPLSNLAYLIFIIEY